MTKEKAKDKKVRRDRREEILNEATKLFGEGGFRGTSLASVAKAVDLTEPGLLHYFPSKVHLLQGVLEYRDKQDEKKYRDLLESDQGSIFESLGSLVAENERIPVLIRLFTVLVGESIRPDHPSHDYFLNRYTEIRNIFSNQISEKFDTAQLDSSADVDKLAALYIAVMDGLQIQWLLDPESMSMSDSFNLFNKIIFDYLEE